LNRIFIIKTGATFPNTAKQLGDFDAWTLNGLNLNSGEVNVVDVIAGDDLPKAETCRGIVITGSHAMVTDCLPWSKAIAAWIPSIIKAAVPLLGICYGHQLLAWALGGEVGFHPGGKEIGSVDIHLLPDSIMDPLFCKLPSPFKAHTSHSQTVLSLPQDAVRLASNSFDPNQAFRVGSCAWGVQFHPEYNQKIMESYIFEQTGELETAGLDTSALTRTISDTPVAASILRHFAAIVGREWQS
jgi:GMP synthase (glutamine-hydrolysing)